jgi:hypothetical protein
VVMRALANMQSTITRSLSSVLKKAGEKVHAHSPRDYYSFRISRSGNAAIRLKLILIDS